MSRRIGDAGRRAEKALSKRLGMKQTPASGAAMTKGDLENEAFKLEVKSTASDRLGLTLNVLEKIHSEAINEGKLPGLAVQFTDLAGRATPNRSWVMVPEWVWTQLELKRDK